MHCTFTEIELPLNVKWERVWKAKLYNSSAT